MLTPTPPRALHSLPPSLPPSFDLDCARAAATIRGGQVDTSYAKCPANYTGTISIPSYAEGINFQTPGDALLTVVQLFFVNNWHVTYFGAIAATNAEQNYAYWLLIIVFFVSFFIIMQLVVLNTFVAYFISAYEYGMSAEVRR